VAKANENAAKRDVEPQTSSAFNWQKFDGMLLADPSKRFCADYLGVSEDTIERRIKDRFGMTFTEYKALKFDFTVWQIKQAVVNKAMTGNIEAAKYVLSNKSDWIEKRELSVEEVSDRELVEAVRAIADKYKKEE
jgi:hypothetical protein